jgi:hypothetical protein
MTSGRKEKTMDIRLFIATDLFVRKNRILRPFRLRRKAFSAAEYAPCDRAEKDKITSVLGIHFPELTLCERRSARTNLRNLK